MGYFANRRNRKNAERLAQQRAYARQRTVQSHQPYGTDPVTASLLYGHLAGTSHVHDDDRDEDLSEQADDTARDDTPEVDSYDSESDRYVTPEPSYEAPSTYDSGSSYSSTYESSPSYDSGSSYSSPSYDSGGSSYDSGSSGGGSFE